MSVDQRLAAAKEELEKANALAEAGYPVRSIAHYRKCWEAALAAINDASKK